MKIDINNLRREPQFRVTLADGERPSTVSSPTSGSAQVPLHWADVFDASGTIRRCPVCTCEELFVRRDFPQGVGLSIVVFCAIASAVLFFMGWLITSMAVLLTAVLVDRVISIFTGQCIVCYRCRSEFRALPIPRDFPTWDLSTGEKYRDANAD